MGKLRIGVIDIVAKSPSKAWYARVMRANLASIMPQVVGVWCEDEGHEAHVAYYSGYENMADALPEGLDLVFISAFTQSAQLAYALSHYFQATGAVTVLGGPHARAYPDDALKYFDYVVGFTNKALIRDILQDATRHRPTGVYLEAARQPTSLPGVRERWRFIVPLLKKAPFIKIVPMLGSIGCPYTCSFCVDSIVPYQPLDFDVMQADLRFLLKTMKRPRVGWHDPNFGVRFNEYLDAIEEAVPPGSIDFIAESTLSLLTEPNLKRLQHNGFKAILPGIETWFDLGNKSKARKVMGMEKVRQVADHVNLILRYVPYLQANFVLGLDTDEGPEPFELTKRFLDLAPGAFPAYSLLTAFGRSAPLNLDYQRSGRVIGVPFHFLNNCHAMNVRPKNYAWPDFYDRVVDLTAYSFSRQAIARRYRANTLRIPRWMNVLRAISSEGTGRTNYFRRVRQRLDRPAFRDYLEQETTTLPEEFVNPVRGDLGPMWEWLPKGALHHDPHAYLKAEAVV